MNEGPYFVLTTNKIHSFIPTPLPEKQSPYSKAGKLELLNL